MLRGLSALLAIVGAAGWMSLAFYPPECVPVTAASEIFCNRLWSAPLGLMAVGAFGISRGTEVAGSGRFGRWVVPAGYALMTVGNAGEYWLAYQLPHEGPNGVIRSLLWMTVLLGWLLLLVGSTALGASWLRSRKVRRSVGVALLLVIPISVLGAVAFRSPGFGAAVPALALAWLAIRR